MCKQDDDILNSCCNVEDIFEKPETLINVVNLYLTVKASVRKSFEE